MTVRIAEYKADILKEAETSTSRNYAQNLLTAAPNYQRSVARQRASTQDFHQEDLTSYMEKNTEVVVSPSQLVY